MNIDRSNREVWDAINLLRDGQSEIRGDQRLMLATLASIARKIDLIAQSDDLFAPTNPEAAAANLAPLKLSVQGLQENRPPEGRLG
jgi:hypothetical protein